MRVAAFTKYDSLAASTRQRVLQYRPALEQAGITLTHYPLLPNDYVRTLATSEKFPAWRLVLRYIARMAQIARTRADVIWVYAELFPYLPGAFERLASATGKPLVYDCDDAFFHMYDYADAPLSRRILRGKLEPLLSRACACCCGNAYLRDYTARFCPNSLILPTVVDTNIYLPGRSRSGDGSTPVIGWIGSPSTWTYVRPLMPVFRELVESGKARVKIVGAGTAADPDRFPGLELVDWSEEREVAEVQSMDIGIMPLPDDRWARGKCGYKIVQYMACALPVVASPVGVNRDMVSEGLNGFVAESDGQWRMALERLAGDGRLRRRFGAAGRERVVADYSLEAHAPRLVKIMQDCARNA